MVYVTQQTSYLTSFFFFFFAMVTSSTSVSMLFQSTLPQVWTWGISKQEETLVAPLRLRSLSKNHDFSFCCLDLSIFPIFLLSLGSFTNFLKVRHVLYKKKNKNKTKEKSKSIQQTTKISKENMRAYPTRPSTPHCLHTYLTKL